LPSISNRRSNRGSDKIDAVLDAVEIPDLQAATKVLWKEARLHPATATCDCPTIEALCALYDRGYRLVKVLRPKMHLPSPLMVPPGRDGEDSFY